MRLTNAKTSNRTFTTCLQGIQLSRLSSYMGIWKKGSTLFSSHKLAYTSTVNVNELQEQLKERVHSLSSRPQPLKQLQFIKVRALRTSQTGVHSLSWLTKSLITLLQLRLLSIREGVHSFLQPQTCSCLNSRKRLNSLPWDSHLPLPLQCPHIKDSKCLALQHIQTSNHVFPTSIISFLV